MCLLLCEVPLLANAANESGKRCCLCARPRRHAGRVKRTHTHTHTHTHTTTRHQPSMGVTVTPEYERTEIEGAQIYLRTHAFIFHTLELKC